MISPVFIQLLFASGLSILLEAQDKRDSLIPVLISRDEDTSKVNTLIELSDQLRKNGDYFKSMNYADSALNLSTTLDYKFGEQEACSILGILNNRQGNYLLAFDYYQRSKCIVEALGNKDKLARDLGNIGNVYSSQGNYSKAYENYIEALRISELTNNKVNIGTQLCNIGTVFERRGEFTKALNYYIAALDLYKGLNDKTALQTIIGNIGLVHYKLGDTRKAYDFYNQALKLAEEESNKVGVSAQFVHLGVYYYDQKNFLKAIEFFLDAMKIHEEIGDKRGISTDLYNLGLTYIELNKHREAERNLLNSIAIANPINSFENIKSCHEALSNLYTNQGKDNKAFEHYQIAMVAKDSLHSQERNSEITRKEMNYEFEKKEITIKAAHDQEIAVSDAKRKSQRTFWLILTSSLFIISLLSFSIYRKRQSDLFEQQLIEVRQEALNAQMSDHFISNAMVSINRFIEDNDKEKASMYLLKFSRLIRQVMQNSFEKTISLKKDLEIMEKFIQLEKLRFAEEMLSYNINIDEDIDIDNTAVPPMILQVLTENSIKHGFQKIKYGEINLNIHRSGDFIEFIFEDNGIGRKAASSYSKESKHISLGSGIAARLIQTFNKSKGKTSFTIYDLLDENNEPKGTKVVFTLPFVEIS